MTDGKKKDRIKKKYGEEYKEESMSIAEMKERKRELGYSYEQIADKSGVPLSTVQKVFSGATQSPRYETLCALEKVLWDYPPSMVKETVCEYGKGLAKKQGEYTMEDYYNWPEDERIELIDGVIYYMSSPCIIHQAIVGEIDYALKTFVKQKKGKCRIFGAGIDVRLDCDDRTIVIPDITVVCKKDNFTEQYLNGAPDLAVEVLSPSTRKKDMTIKLSKYAGAGVREYWVVDPQKETVVVYKFNHENEEDAEVSFYTFENQVPVGIFDDECIVDFKEIKEYLEG